MIIFLSYPFVTYVMLNFMILYCILTLHYTRSQYVRQMSNLKVGPTILRANKLLIFSNFQFWSLWQVIYSS